MRNRTSARARTGRARGRTAALSTAGAALATLALLAGAGVVALPAQAATPAEPFGDAASTDTVDLVDADATPETRSLFAYLRDVRGDGILFGHQHTTSYGLTFDTDDGASSDVRSATGDLPAVFGWDTLIIQGDERPGKFGGTAAENVAILADSIEEADAAGGINTLSAHMENFVTGKSFYDTTGDTLRAVLPGGAKNADLDAYLDDIALLAQSVHSADGALVPIVFRPWHENAGSWFWWGAAFGSPGEYEELYRYTVEYLRDVKGVHNLLYAFSPGGGFGGNAEQYLRTYPGDDFVDLLGYDTYDDTGSQSFLDGLVADLGMIADLADERGKISAVTEFGVSGGVGSSGKNPEGWFTKVLGAIKGDARAARNAYMLTWANFDAGQHFVPVPGDSTYEDFQAYAADPFTLFAPEVEGAFERVTTAVPARPLVHLVSPADGARVATGPTTVRVTVQGVEPDRVYVTSSKGATVELGRGDGLWWTGEWAIPAAQLDNSSQDLAVHVVVDGAEALTDDASVVVGPRPTFPVGVVDDFEGYGDDAALRAEYVSHGANTLSLETGVHGGGSKALRMDYDFASQTYTGLGKQVGADWSGLNELSLWVQPDGSNNTMVLQLVAGGVSYEAYPSLAGTTASVVTVPFRDWRPAPWDTSHADRRITAEDLRSVSQLNVYVNHADGGAPSGSIVVDDIAAKAGPPTFSDVPRGHPVETEILWLYGQGLDTGYPDGTFRPTRTETRRAAASLLYRYAGASFTPTVRKPSFKDVPKKDRDYAAVEWLVDQKIVSNKPVPLFLPDAPLDRSSAAQLLWKLAGSPEPEAAATFTDVPSWFPYAQAIAWATETGVVTPVSATQYGVLRLVTRQDMAAYLYRYDHLPTPLEPQLLYDFTDGAQGWSSFSGTATGTGGALAVDSPAPDGTWAGVQPGAIDLTGRTELRFDLAQTTGTDTKVALQLGDSWTWCETATTGWIAGPRVDADAVVVDLTTLSADCQALLGDVKGINIYLNAGQHVLDDVEVR
ncbi:glycosyl hydrolase [Cellulomonas sp. URHB0016]